MSQAQRNWSLTMAPFRLQWYLHPSIQAYLYIGHKHVIMPLGMGTAQPGGFPTFLLGAKERGWSSLRKVAPACRPADADGGLNFHVARASSTGRGRCDFCSDFPAHDLFRQETLHKKASVQPSREEGFSVGCWSIMSHVLLLSSKREPIQTSRH